MTTLALSTNDWLWIRSDATEWKTVASNSTDLTDGSVTTAKLADNFTVALFQSTTANTLAAGFKQETANHLECVSFNHYMTAGTTFSTTFKVRAGNGASQTTTFNGQPGSRKLGDIMASSITITGIEV